MNNKAVFLDRDGTINVDKPDIYRVEGFELIPKAAQALKRLKGYKIIVITNQGKIGRGICTEKDVEKLNDYMRRLLKKQGVVIDGIYYCPHHPDEGCDCRKPNTKLIKKAAEDFKIDLTKSFMVGDKTSDIKLGQNVGCRTILVKTGSAGKDGRHEVKPDYIAEDLDEAVKWIVAQK